MHLENLIVDLALILIASGIVTLIFRRLKQPVVLGYIVAGFLISPNFEYLPNVVEQADISVWGELGVIFLMFGLGLEFSFKKIATVGGSAFTIAITVMAAMLFVGAGAGHLMGWNDMDCLFLGGMLSMSSTMIIMKAYEEYGLKEESFARMVLGALVIEDIAGVFMLIILSTISVSRNVSGLALGRELGLLIIYLAFWLLLGIYILPSVLKKISGLLNEEITVVISLAICLLMVVIANYIGFSSALGAFLSGSILAGTVRGEEIERLTKPVKNLFGAVFFVSVGMLIQPALLVKYIVPILILSAVTILGQKLFATIGILLSGQTLYAAIRGGSSMVQIGEFSFIVATLGMNLGVISSHLYPIIVCVSVITAFATPAIMKTSEKEYEFWKDHLPARLRGFLRRNTSSEQSRFSMDEDWFAFTGKIVLRTGVCSVFLFIIYIAGTEYLDPFLRQYIHSDPAASAAAAAITVAAMIPFVNFMHGVDRTLYARLWMKHRTNRLPLITLKAVRVLIAACFLALVLHRYLKIPFALLVLIAAIPIVFIVRSEWISGVTNNMKMQFLANFSEKTLARAKAERAVGGEHHWLDESLYVRECRVTDTDKMQTILDFAGHMAFRVTIIRIIRGKQVLNLPNAETKIVGGDLLHMMGTADEIRNCAMLLQDDPGIEFTDRQDMKLKEYIYAQDFYGIDEDDRLLCIPLRVDSSSEFVRRSIRRCGMRKRYKGTIIGIERGDLPMISPGVETVILRGDILWVMGGSEMAELLTERDLLQE